MATHKTKPKLKKYKTLGLSRKKDSNNSRINFFLPEYTYLTFHLKKLEQTFSNSLNNRRKVKLLFGFNQSYKLLNFIKAFTSVRNKIFVSEKSISACLAFIIYSLPSTSLVV